MIGATILVVTAMALSTTTLVVTTATPNFQDPPVTKEYRNLTAAQCDKKKQEVIEQYITSRGNNGSGGIVAKCVRKDDNSSDK